MRLLWADPLRVFLALMPPSAVRRILVRYQNQWDLPAPARAVPAQQLHVTLYFLGEVAEQRLPALKQALDLISWQAGDLRIDRAGWFRRAGVAWLAATRVDNALAQLRRRLIVALEPFGPGERHRPWQPHITLYRKLRKPPPTLTVEPLQWNIDGFHLMQSLLTPEGPRYRSLAVYKCREDR